MGSVYSFFYNERDSGISPHWHYVNDMYDYHVRILIHKENMWFNFVGLFCGVFFQIHMDTYYG